jgi:3,4-dihydroxy 2-butanone 4-phosphate synthase/GTP cyclohydrolase II
VPPTRDNLRYLLTKRDRMGHDLPGLPGLPDLPDLPDLPALSEEAPQ